jgi:hypothetical protein
VRDPHVQAIERLRHSAAAHAPGDVGARERFAPQADPDPERARQLVEPLRDRQADNRNPEPVASGDLRNRQALRVTRTGVMVLVVVPLPSSPNALLPADHREPSLFSTKPNSLP